MSAIEILARRLVELERDRDIARQSLAEKHRDLGLAMDELRRLDAAHRHARNELERARSTAGGVVQTVEPVTAGGAPPRGAEKVHSLNSTAGDQRPEGLPSPGGETCRAK